MCLDQDEALDDLPRCAVAPPPRVEALPELSLPAAALRRCFLVLRCPRDPVPRDADNSVLDALDGPAGEARPRRGGGRSMVSVGKSRARPPNLRGTRVRPPSSSSSSVWDAWGGGWRGMMTYRRDGSARRPRRCCFRRLAADDSSLGPAPVTCRAPAPVAPGRRVALVPLPAAGAVAALVE